MPATLAQSDPNVPAPDAAEARDNATFLAVLSALSRPGTVHGLPDAGACPLAQALIDRECRVWTDSPHLAEVLAMTGATLVPPELADHLFLSLDSAEGVERLSRAQTGSRLYPDQGATVVAPARVSQGPALDLTGPGIDGTRRLSLGGLDPQVWRVRAALNRYPQGIEMLFHDGAALVALPRSTHVTEI